MKTGTTKTRSVLVLVPSFWFSLVLVPYAGQRDPNDPSHLVIAYERAAERGHLDIWLRADEQFKVEFCDGPGRE
jgi:hypothetical protein